MPLEVKNHFDPAHWADLPRPIGFQGPVWPPTTILDLVPGDLRQQCIGCGRINQACGCDDTSIERRAKTDIVKIVELENDVCVRAEQPFTQGSSIYLDAGTLRPATNDLTAGRAAFSDAIEDRRRYTSKFSIGQRPIPIGQPQTYCWHDTYDHYGAPHFARHSCNPNAEIRECRYGPFRVRLLVALRDIRPGEEITRDWTRNIAQDAFGQLWCIRCDNDYNCPTLSIPRQGYIGSRRSNAHQEPGVEDTDAEEDEVEHVPGAPSRAWAPWQLPRPEASSPIERRVRAMGTNQRIGARAR